jgi:tRNA pseudouridine38-40 synthase
MIYTKIILSYDGTKYQGSATQISKNTVEDTITDILKLLNIKSKIVFSGRTDKNVHALRQVASLKVPDFWSDLEKLKTTLNRQLPNSIKIKSIKKVDEKFHARFSATKREYRYILSTKPTTPFNNNYIYYHKNIDFNLINEASKLFIGVNDFEYFSKKGSEPLSTIREICNIRFYKYKDFYILKFSANSFLRSQIRMMVDFLLKISDKKLTIKDLKNQLDKKQLKSWTLAKANALYLSRVFY